MRCDPAGRAYSAPQDLLAVVKGKASKKKRKKEGGQGGRSAGGLRPALLVLNVGAF